MSLDEIQSLARELGCPIPAALLRSITPHPSSSSGSSFPQLLSVLSPSKLLPASGSLFPQLGVCSHSPGQLCIFLMCSGPGGSWTLATHTPQGCNPFLSLCHSNCQYCILHGRECPGVTQGVVGTSWGVPHLAVPSVVTDVLTDDIIGERHVYLMKALEVLLTCTKPRGYRLGKLWMTLIKTLHRFRQSKFRMRQGQEFGEVGWRSRQDSMMWALVSKMKGLRGLERTVKRQGRGRPEQGHWSLLKVTMTKQ